MLDCSSCSHAAVSAPGPSRGPSRQGYRAALLDWRRPITSHQIPDRVQRIPHRSVACRASRSPARDTKPAHRYVSSPPNSAGRRAGECNALGDQLWDDHQYNSLPIPVLGQTRCTLPHGKARHAPRKPTSGAPERPRGAQRLGFVLPPLTPGISTGTMIPSSWPDTADESRKWARLTLCRPEASLLARTRSHRVSGAKALFGPVATRWESRDRRPSFVFANEGEMPMPMPETRAFPMSQALD